MPPISTSTSTNLKAGLQKMPSGLASGLFSNQSCHVKLLTTVQGGSSRSLRCDGFLWGSFARILFHIYLCQWPMKVQLDLTMIHAWFDPHAIRNRCGYRGVRESITSPGKSIINGGWTEGNVWIYRLLCDSTTVWMHSKRICLDALCQHWEPEWKKKKE